MEYLHGWDAYSSEDESVITLGKFDGLHKGHQLLLETVIEIGRKENLKTMVFAFDMVPFFLRRHIPVEYIMSGKERVQYLEGRVDTFIECPFSEEISKISAEDFIEKVLIDRFHVKEIVVGTDFCFGHGKKGNANMLRELESKYGYKTHVIEKKEHHGRIISSTLIKECIRQGDMEEAKTLLGYSYELSGEVIHGYKIGSTKLGIPTMNVMPEKGKLLPPFGVYAVKCVLNHRVFLGIGNLGVKPTIEGEREASIEVHLFDFHEDVYGKTVRIKLEAFQRPELKFTGLEELKETMEKDIEIAKSYFKNQKK